MTWEWSHTLEAYDDARKNLEELPREVLEVIYSEWIASYRGPYSRTELHERKYQQTLHGRAKRLTDAQLIEFIWQRASEQRDCTNGGHMAHLCPFGCSCHAVPFTYADPNPNHKE